jgi:hypothetical protein
MGNPQTSETSFADAPTGDDNSTRPSGLIPGLLWYLRKNFAVEIAEGAALESARRAAHSTKKGGGNGTGKAAWQSRPIPVGASDGRTTRFGRKALSEECRIVAGTPKGNRNHQTNSSAHSIGTLVAAGHVNEDEARTELTAASIASGQDPADAAKAVNSGLTDGMTKPREGAPDHPDNTEYPPIEGLDYPFGGTPPANWPTSHAGEEGAPVAAPAPADPAPTPASTPVGSNGHTNGHLNGHVGPAPTTPTPNVAPDRVPATARSTSSPYPSGPVQLRNWVARDNGAGGSIYVGRHLSLVMDDVLRRGLGWPKIVAKQIVLPPEKTGDPPQLVKNPNELFSWFQTIFPGDAEGPPVDWRAKDSDKPSKSEFLEFLRRRLPERYDSFELYPHWPPVPRVLYLNPPLPKATGRDLVEFTSRFFAATPEDDDLIRAATMTMFWGGPPGKRPGILITANDSNMGRGAGKSTMAMKMASLVGGHVTIDPNEDEPGDAFVSEDVAHLRVALIDNLKSLNFSNSKIEGMITDTAVSGWMLYHGRTRKPNHYTWFLTVNSPGLSKDFAERFVPISIKKAITSPKWSEDLDQFIEERRWHIAADAIAELQASPKPLSTYSRHPEWTSQIISKLPDPAAIFNLVGQRQKDQDGDTDRGLEMEAIIAKALEVKCYKPLEHKVFIDSQSLFDIIKPYVERKSISWALRELFTLPLKRLSKSKDHNKRGAVWNADLENEEEGDYRQLPPI